MPDNSPSSLAAMRQLAPRDAGGVTSAVAGLLSLAIQQHVSDLHCLPTSSGLELSWRRDGVMQVVASWPGQWGPNVVARLKVLADLLTYRTDLPQEGRLRCGREISPDATVEMRLSTFPTLHGEKAVVRFFVGSGTYQQLTDLGFPQALQTQFRRLLRETSGCIVISGPAGSGKTTTAYACLREILTEQQRQRSVSTLEDPIEAELLGASQTQVNRPAELTYAMGLRSLMRQDPDVILVGEVRDAETAATAFRASLTGHLILTTLHAGSTAQAVTRLRDLGVDSYLLRAGLRGVACQRLLRKLCRCQDAAGMARENCQECWGTGLRGRLLISELLTEEPLAEILRFELESATALSLEQRMVAAGLRPLCQLAAELVERGATTAAEVYRVLGSLPGERRPTEHDLIAENSSQRFHGTGG